MCCCKHQCCCKSKCAKCWMEQTTAEANDTELAFRRRHEHIPYAVEQRMIRLGEILTSKDGETMGDFLERLWELAQ